MSIILMNQINIIIQKKFFNKIFQNCYIIISLNSELKLKKFILF